MAETTSQLKSKLTDRQMSVFNSEIAKHQKSTGLAYVLWFFLGTIGVHKFYMGKPKQGTVYLLLGVVGWITLLVGMVGAMAAGVAAAEEGASMEAAGQAASGMSALTIVGTIALVILGVLLLIDLFTIPKQLSKQYELKEREIMDRLGAESAGTTSEGTGEVTT